MTPKPSFLTRVRIKNYKSIAACDVKLGNLAFLVGPNGSGKSNFLDALSFVADALGASPEKALNDRVGKKIRSLGGAISEIRRKGSGGSTAVRLDFHIPGGLSGHYSVQLGPNEQHQHNRGEPTFFIEREECRVEGPTSTEWFRVARSHNGAPPPEWSLDYAPPTVTKDLLFLAALRGIEPFDTARDALLRMRFYSLSPEAIREETEPDPSPLLHRDGRNLPSLLDQLKQQHPETKERIEAYLRLLVPGARSVSAVSVDQPGGSKVMVLELRQDLDTRHRGSQWPGWPFLAPSVSDGTLRALGILTALLQDGEPHPSLVAIEEPEVALHPAAVGILLGAMRSASESTQVLVTTHSPELLHSDEVRTDELLAVSAETGVTVVGGIDVGSRDILADRLFSPGELLRLDQLEPDGAAPPAACDDTDLFEL